MREFKSKAEQRRFEAHQARCECEHKAHFDREARTPNGNPGHRHDISFFKARMVQVKTTYGHFLVCPDCKNDCCSHIS